MIMLDRIVEGIEAALEYQLQLDYEHSIAAMWHDFPTAPDEWYSAESERRSFQSNPKIWQLSFALLQAYGLQSASDNRT